MTSAAMRTISVLRLPLRGRSAHQGRTPGASAVGTAVRSAAVLI